MALGTYTKQPWDVTDIDVDFSEWLATRPSDTLVSATATSDNPALVVDDAVALSTTVAKVWVSGGASGVTYKVTVRVITDYGRHKEVEVKVKVRDT
jgi:hypothetical protein